MNLLTVAQWGQPGKNGIFHMKILVNLHIHQPIYFKSSSKPQLIGEKMEKNQSFRAQNHKIHVIFDCFLEKNQISNDNTL